MAGIPDRLLPPRPEWDPAGGMVNFMHLPSSNPAESPDLYAMVVDTGSARVVTFWLRETLEQLLRNGLGMLGVTLPDALTIAAPDDLRDLPPLDGPSYRSRDHSYKGGR